MIEMWMNDLIDAANRIEDWLGERRWSVCIKEVTPVNDGIVFHTTIPVLPAIKWFRNTDTVKGLIGSPVTGHWVDNVKEWRHF